MRTLLLFFLSIFFEVNAQKIELIGDLNQYPDIESRPQQLTIVGNKLFFTAYVGTYGSINTLNKDENLGRQLYCTNLTDSTTHRISKIKGIRVTNGFYDDVLHIVAADTFVYVVEYKTDSTTIWRTDGTDLGTYQIKVFSTSSLDRDGNFPLNFFNNSQLIPVFFKGKLFFIKSTDNGYELWKSGQTPNSATKISNLPIPYQDYGISVSVFQDKIIYKGDGTYDTGKGIWAIDSTGVTVELFSSFSSDLNVSSEFFYFISPIYPYSIWKSDGTKAGTVPIYTTPLDQFGSIIEIVVNKEEVFWIQRNNGNTVAELRKSDGLGGYSKLFEGGIKDLTNFKNHIYFVGNNSILRTDGSIEGTKELETNYSFNDIVKEIVVCGENLFITNTATEGLWKINETIVEKISNKRFEFTSTASKDNTLFTLGNDKLTGWELWKSDGTSSGTYLWANVNRYNGSLELKHPHQIGEKIVFLREIAGSYLGLGSSFYQVYQTNGTKEGTLPISSLYLEQVAYSVKLKNKIVYFSEREIVVSNGSNDGTQKIFSFSDTIYIEVLNTSLKPIAFKGWIYFFVNSKGIQQVWKTDGTVENTMIDLNFNEEMSGINGYVQTDQYLYFFNSSTTSASIWQYDGSNISIKKKNIKGSKYALFKDKIIMYAESESYNYPILIVDLATMNVDTLNFKGTFVVNDEYILLNGYFSDGKNPTEIFPSVLYRTDGTKNGTVEIKNISFGGYYGDQYFKSNKQIYFIVFNSENKVELWKTGGTIETTILIKTINSELYNFKFQFEFNGYLYFSASNGLWQTDGTSENTILVKEHFTGLNSSIKYKNQMFFSAYDGKNASINYELYKMYFDDCQSISIPITIMKQK